MSSDDTIVVLNDRLSQEIRAATLQEVKALSKLKPFVGIANLLFDWVLIFGSIAFAMYMDSFLISMLAMFIVAGRQHALLAMQHEAVHYRLMQSRFWNDRAGNWLAAYPIFWDMNGYRDNHFQHHKYLNSDKDPDWKRKYKVQDWEFPKSKSDLFKIFIRYAWGYGILENFRMAKVMSGKAQLYKIVEKTIYYSAILTVFYYFHLLQEFALFWLLPYFFIYPMFQKFRSISEHFGLPFKNELNNTRNILTHPLEAFFFGPHNINYHLDHHMFPTVPGYSLPALNRILLKQPSYRKHAFQNTSYVYRSAHSVLSDLIKKPEEQGLPDKIPKAA